MKHTAIINATKTVKVRTSQLITVGAVALTAFFATSANAVITFDDQAAFEAALLPSTASIRGFANLALGPLPHTLNYPAYTISALLDGQPLYGVDVNPNNPVNPAVSVLGATDGIIVEFDEPQRAVGGLFFRTDEEGTFTPGAIRVTLTDGTSEVLLNSPNASDRFRGFLVQETDSVAIISMTILKDPAGDATEEYVTLDRLMNLPESGVSPVPEPTTLLAGLLLVLPFGMSAIRTLRRRSPN